MTRTCEAVGCTATVAIGIFMCLNHWRLVPFPIRRVINTRWRAYPSGQLALLDPQYVEACAQAVEHIAKAEGRPTNENSYRRLLLALMLRKGVA